MADDAKNSGLTSDEQPEIYFLQRAVADDWTSRHALLVVASALPEATVAGWVRVISIRRVPVKIEPLTETVNRLADRPRFETALLGFFALMGLVMAVVGACVPDQQADPGDWGTDGTGCKTGEHSDADCMGRTADGAGGRSAGTGGGAMSPERSYGANESRWPRVVRKSGPFRSLLMPAAAMYSSR
nr:hypothetical protein [Granulicella sp. L60]